MSTQPVSEVIDHDRRQLLSNAAIGIAVTSVANILPAFPSKAAASAEIRPFRVHFPEEALVDLRRRLPQPVCPHKKHTSPIVRRTGKRALIPIIHRDRDMKATGTARAALR